MDKETKIEQLIYRRKNVEELLNIQTNKDIKDLFNAELYWIEAQIDFYNKYDVSDIKFKWG